MPPPPEADLISGDVLDVFVERNGLTPRGEFETDAELRERLHDAWRVMEARQRPEPALIARDWANDNELSSWGLWFRNRPIGTVESIEDHGVRVRTGPIDNRIQVRGVVPHVEFELSIAPEDDLEFEPAITSLSYRPKDPIDVVRQLVLTPLTEEQSRRLAKSLSGKSMALSTAKAALRAEWVKLRTEKPIRSVWERLLEEDL